MQVTKFGTTQFGGIKGVELEFQPGLNVILGPNESGKSTIVNAICSALFRPSALDRRSGASRDFQAQFFPHPQGTSCDSRIGIVTDTGSYTLDRKWGAGASSSLELPDGTRIEGEERVEEILDGLFELGRYTYERIVFARQRDMKQVLDQLRDDQLIESVGSLLRKAVMQLDGVSIDKLKAGLEQESRELLSRWDLQRNGPEGNRGLANPWKSGVGAILKAWYAKEELRQQISRVENLEAEISRLRLEVTKLEREKKQAAVEIQELAQLETDVLRRAELEPKRKEFQGAVDELKKVNREWPLIQREIEELEAKLTKLGEEKATVDREFEAHISYTRRLELEKVFQQIQQRAARIAELENELSTLPKVSCEAIEELTCLGDTILSAEAAIQAGTLLAQISLHTQLPVYVTRDLEGEVLLNGQETRAQGFLKLRLGELAEVEIRAGEEDFKQIIVGYEAAKARQYELLKGFGLESSDDVRAVRKQIEHLERDIAKQKEDIQSLLQDQTPEQLAMELEELASLPQPRNKEVLKEKRLELEQDTLESKTRHSILKETADNWSRTYGDAERAMDFLAEAMGDLKQVQRQLDEFAPLPEQFNTAQDFSSHLHELRQHHDKLVEDINASKQALYALELELPQTSLAELGDHYRYLTRQFETLRQRGEKLRLIEAAFAETIAEMDGNSFDPLAHSFSKYLTRITLGKYKLGNVDDQLDIQLLNNDNGIPVNLLSSGTYDCTALSLRFALLENIFGPEGGMVVLDDCLVDLDPQRRREAIALIREYAKSNQVIFTTCNPETAGELEGNLIEVAV